MSLRADHQRHEVVTEAGADRDDEEEEHRRGVHREELVVEVLPVLGQPEVSPHASVLASGVASCVRIRRAISPATTKKNTVVIRYIIPIFLWSVVVIQLHRPPS